MPLNLDDLARDLRKAAEKITDYEWELLQNDPEFESSTHQDVDCFDAAYSLKAAKRITPVIATVTPGTILALLDERDELRKYAQHHVNCAAILSPVGGTTPRWSTPPRPCDCGLVDLFS